MNNNYQFKEDNDESEEDDEEFESALASVQFNTVASVIDFLMNRFVPSFWSKANEMIFPSTELGLKEETVEAFQQVGNLRSDDDQDDNFDDDDDGDGDDDDLYNDDIIKSQLHRLQDCCKFQVWRKSAKSSSHTR